MDIHPAVLTILIPLLMLGGMLLALETGFRLGRKRRIQRTGDTNDEIGAVVAAVLGLLGLTLAFTFSAASERLTARRAQIVEEANAISTAYLRLDLLAPDDQQTMRALFRDYVDSRIEAFQRITDAKATRAALDRGARLQQEIWHRSIAAARTSPNRAAPFLLLDSLNKMFDITTTRDLATTTHAPGLVTGLLVALSFMGALLAGDTLALKGRRNMLHMGLFALAIAATVYVVIDLEYPRVGLITLRHMDRAMIQLQDQMH
jgi:MFS family permease